MFCILAFVKLTLWQWKYLGAGHIDHRQWLTPAKNQDV